MCVYICIHIYIYIYIHIYIYTYMYMGGERGRERERERERSDAGVSERASLGSVSVSASSELGHSRLRRTLISDRPMLVAVAPAML